MDFQDALHGTITYDIMSLMEDARRDIDPQLLADMRDELDAADRYRSTALSCSNRPLKPLLERIALDETLHAECLQRLIRMAGCCA